MIQFCKRKNIPVGPGRGCFLPNNKVFTNKGYKNIQDITTKDMVLSHDGTFNNVENLLCYDIDEEIIEIEFENGKRISCTLDHEIFVERSGVKKWIEAKYIVENDKIVKIC